jgi:O-antigen ligase
MLICGYGVYQYFWGFRHVTESLIRNRIYYPFAYEWLSRKRVFSTFFTPNAFAGFLIMALPLTFSIKHYQRDIKDTSKFILFALVLLTINLLLAQSISAILSFVLSICLILSMKNPKKNYLFISIILGLLVVAVIFYLRNKTGRAFITPLFSWEKRIAYYKEALWMIKQHPLWGIGWGNFVGKDSLFVHNSYLQIWIELGILGIFSLGGIIFTTIRSAFQRIAAEPEAKSYLLPLFCAFLAFAIHNLIDFTFYLPEVTWLWWIVIAIIIS